jgi:hypothetical protein
LNGHKIFIKLGLHPSLELNRGRNKTLNHNNPTETEQIGKTRTDTRRHKLISRLGKNNNTEIYYISKPVAQIGNKLVLPRGTASYNSVSRLKDFKRDIVASLYVPENEYISTGLMYFIVENENQAENLRWYFLRSKLVRFLFLVLNVQSELTKGFVSRVPAIALDRKFTDRDVYQYFNLDQDEINHIENIIS